jgi:hypothetical protein
LVYQDSTGKPSSDHLGKDNCYKESYGNLLESLVMKVEERRAHKEKKKFSVILVKLSVMILPKNRRIRYFEGLGVSS